MTYRVINQVTWAVSPAVGLAMACSDGQLERSSSPGQDMSSSPEPADLLELRDQDAGLPDDSGQSARDVGDADLPDTMTPELSDMPQPDMPDASGRVPAILAQGQADRMMISCDDGRTWRQDRAIGTQYVCFDRYTLCTEGDPLDCDCQATPAQCAPDTFFDCNHSSYSATGLVQAGDWIIETRGWGKAGGVRRTRNGVDWEEMWPEFKSSGLAYAEGVLISGGYWVKRSSDFGETWSESISTTFASNNNVRAHGVGSYKGETLVVFMGNKGTLTLSSDAGETWWEPESFPEACGDNVKGPVVFMNDVIYVVDSQGQVCTSSDGGRVWTLAKIAGAFKSTPIVHEGKLKIWEKGKMWSTSDGITWQDEALTPASAQPAS